MIIQARPAYSGSTVFTTARMCKQLLNYHFISAEMTRFFMDYDIQVQVRDAAELYDYCISQLPDIPRASVTIVNKTDSHGIEYSYCQVDNGRGLFFGSTTTFHSRLYPHFFVYVQAYFLFC